MDAIDAQRWVEAEVAIMKDFVESLDAEQESLLVGVVTDDIGTLEVLLTSLKKKLTAQSEGGSGSLDEVLEEEKDILASLFGGAV